MNEFFSKNALMICGCNKEIQPGIGVITKHTYSITKIFKCADDDPDYHELFLIRIMNPWGHKEWKGDWSE